MAESDSLQLRRSNRISQTNLLAKQNNDQGENTDQGTETKPYILNKMKSLIKKLDSCTKEDVNYELKAGNNLVLHFSTAAYELAKQIIESKAKILKKQYDVVIEPSKDRLGARVGIRLKVGKKQTDCYQKQYFFYTINCYDTQSSMLINGNKFEMFETDIFQDILDNIKSRKSQLENANLHAQNIISTALQNSEILSEAEGNKQVKNVEQCSSLYTVSAVSSVPVTNSHGSTPHIQSELSKSRGNSPLAIEAGPNLQDECRFVDEKEYSCPICLESSMTRSIACDMCNEWIHFQCVGIPPEKEKEMDNLPFVCSQCNAEAQYLQCVQFEDTQKCDLSNDNRNPCDLSNDNSYACDLVTDNRNMAQKDLQTLDPTSSKTPTSIICENKEDTFVKSPVEIQQAILPNNETFVKSNSISEQVIGGSTPSTSLASTRNETSSEKASVGTQKQAKSKKKTDLEQKQYTMSLEKAIKEQEKTIKLLQKNLEIMDKNSQSNTENLGTNADQNQALHNTTHCRQSLQDQMLETRLRILENQNTQNLSIFTALTSSLALQLTNQRCNHFCQACSGTSNHQNHQANPQQFLQNWHGNREWAHGIGHMGVNNMGFPNPTATLPPPPMYQGQSGTNFGMGGPGQPQMGYQTCPPPQVSHYPHGYPYQQTQGMPPPPPPMPRYQAGPLPGSHPLTPPNLPLPTFSRPFLPPHPRFPPPRAEVHQYLNSTQSGQAPSNANMDPQPVSVGPKHAGVPMHLSAQNSQTTLPKSVCEQRILSQSSPNNSDHHTQGGAPVTVVKRKSYPVQIGTGTELPVQQDLQVTSVELNQETSCDTLVNCSIPMKPDDIQICQTSKQHCDLLTPISTKRTKESKQPSSQQSETQKKSFLEIPSLHPQPPDKIGQYVVRHN